jgi:two-component system phosphate regulon sensor histidine kinase PhoR
VLIARFETAKGWIFVTLASGFLYAVTLWSARRLARAQRTISAVVDSIADGVLLLGSDRRIRRANGAATRMLGCDDLVGMDAEAFSRRFRLSYPDGSLVRPDEYISQRVFEEGGPLRYKAVLHPPGGSDLVISATAAAVRERADEAPSLVVSVMHDITTTEHLARMRDEFFAAAAHTLKTPVAIIQAHAQALDYGDGARLAHAREGIDRQCRRIDRLVQNLLVLARAGSGSLQLHPHEIELGPLVARAAAEMADAAVPARVVRTDLQATPRVCADPERLALALRNLLDRAVRYAVAASPIDVRLMHDGQEARVAVQYASRPAAERIVEAYGDYDEPSIARLVAETIIGAHGGRLGEDTVGGMTTAWLTMTTVQGDGAGA